MKTENKKIQHQIMKALICKEPGKFEYQNIKKPVPEKGKAIIKIKRIGICGTDLHAFEGNQPFFKYPRIFGHELSGELISHTGSGNFNEGQKVTIIPYFHCGKCIACKSGKPNCCDQIKVCGVHIDGGMTEYIQVPSNSLVSGKGLTFNELALVEPLSIGAHGVNRANIKPNETTLVVGAGPIGLSIIHFLKIQGARVIVLDIDNQRLDYCKKTAGADLIINSEQEDPYEKIKKYTNSNFPTALFDATGNKNAINNTFKYMAHGARYIIVGLQKGNIVLNHPEFHKREGTLMSSRNATRKDFEYVVNCLQNKKIKASNFITHETPFSMIKDEFEQLFKPENRQIKTIIRMGE